MTAAVIDFKAAKARICLRRGQPVNERVPDDRRNPWIDERRVEQLLAVLDKMWPDGPAAC
jgi:hypothetical protein